MRHAAWILVLGGCGWSQDRFQEEWNQTYCTRYDDCGYLEAAGYASVDDCLSRLEEIQDQVDGKPCEDWDGGAAKQCVQGYEDLSCDDLTDPEALPEACDEACADG